MTWLIGIDEAGYGPNLGPLVMSAVACRVPNANACLWTLLKQAVRRCADGRDARLVIDDSKAVYTSSQGLVGLERGLRAVIELPATLAELVQRLAPSNLEEIAAEPWFTGQTTLPIEATANAESLEPFTRACQENGVGSWIVASVVVCPRRFNAIVDRHDSKAAVLGQGFICLLADLLKDTAHENEPVFVFVDKQGGRNTYAAQIQAALTAGLVYPFEESAARSHYRISGLSRDVHLTFQPRADQLWFNVALASMVSKYLRELFMREYNAFWCARVPGLRPTAGYPGDARRYLDAIRDEMQRLKIPEENLWRRR